MQGLLRQTEAEHPDYYLLLVCIQQFRSFTAQYHHLLQHNQELLLHNCKEVKRSESARARQCRSLKVTQRVTALSTRCRSTMKHLLKTVESGIQTNSIGSPYPCSGAML